jgi:predicted Holliday junction resolvase-like endonuclease
MQEMLLVVIAVLAILVLVMWARTRASAQRQFDRWRDQEMERVERDATRRAEAAAALELRRWEAERETAIRRDAVARSSSVVTGKAAEQLAPYLAGFPYNPRDVRFLGSPVDLVVFDGLEAGDVRCVALVEVKYGTGQLSTRQRQVRDAVRRGDVTWVEWRPPMP